MLLLGFKTQRTSTGDWSSVDHQSTHVILNEPNSTVVLLTKKYNEMVKKGEDSQKKLSELSDTLEWSNITEKEYDKLATKYSQDIQILKYDSILIIEGTVLK